MRQIPAMLRLLLCSLLIGGYGAMYAGSVLHDLGHSVEAAQHSAKHCDHTQAVAGDEHESHLEVPCFFCTHAPVISSDLVVEQTWTPAIAALAPPAECAFAVHSPSRTLPSLRGPPTA